MKDTSWIKMFSEFKRRNPELLRRGTTYAPYEYGIIEVRIPTVGRLLFNSDQNKIVWVEHYSDPRIDSELDKASRPDMYNRFCQIVLDYIHVNGMTNQQFADMVGISRQMLSKYLNGVSIPKVNTMRQICNSINISI